MNVLNPATINLEPSPYSFHGVALQGGQQAGMFTSNAVGGRRRHKNKKRSRHIKRHARKTYNSFIKKSSRKGLFSKVAHLFSRSNKTKRHNQTNKLRGGNDPNQMVRALSTPASIGAETSCGNF